MRDQLCTVSGLLTVSILKAWNFLVGVNVDALDPVGLLDCSYLPSSQHRCLAQVCSWGGARVHLKSGAQAHYIRSHTGTRIPQVSGLVGCKMGHLCLFTTSLKPYLLHGWTKDSTPTMLPTCWDLPQFLKQEIGRKAERQMNGRAERRRHGAFVPCSQGFWTRITSLPSTQRGRVLVFVGNL